MHVEATNKAGFFQNMTRVMESKKNLLICFFSLLYIVIVCVIAARRMFWNDELYTLYFSQLRAWPDLWWALGTGADQIPPPFLLLTKFCVFLFGLNQISLRLPEIAGFLLMALCLYKIVSRRSSALCGLTAMLFPMMTGAFSYAYEARSYGALLGFSSLAFLCWICAAESQKRKVYLAGLIVGLAGAWMSHYYGILIFGPLLLGELVRSYSRKQLDSGILLSFVIAVLPVLLFLPLIRGSMSYGATFWAKPQWSDLPHFYDFILGPATIIIVFVCIVSIAMSRSRNSGEATSYEYIPSYELVCAVGFVAIPVIGLIVTKILTGAFTDRHALPAVIGFGILIPLALHYFLSSRNLVVMVLICFFAGFLGKAIGDYRSVSEDTAAFNRARLFWQTKADPQLPIVSWFSHPAMRLWYYGPKDLADRVYYLADPAASVRYIGHDTIDRGLLDLKPFFPLKNVQPYDLFLKSHQQFLLFWCSWGEDWRWNWIVYSLLADHRKIELKARNGDQFLYLVSAE
jgi:4-amino-4-deoxy-L-arabinose transferase-like glycosyltransferase